MIKFRGKMIDKDELVEGDGVATDIQFGNINIIHVQGISRMQHTAIIPETLQVLTTDGWADIADVEVVRKNHISEVSKMDARAKLDEFAEITGMNKNQLIGWSIAADFAEWYAEQKALHQCNVSGSLPLTDAEKLAVAWKTLEWVGFRKGEEFEDEDNPEEELQEMEQMEKDEINGNETQE